MPETTDHNEIRSATTSDDAETPTEVTNSLTGRETPAAPDAVGPDGDSLVMLSPDDSPGSTLDEGSSESNSRRERGDLDRKVLENVALLETVVAAARKEGRLESLKKEAITEADLTAWTALAKSTRAKATEVVDAKDDRKSKSATLKDAHSALIASLRAVQKKAKRTFPAGSSRLKTYRIGRNNFGRNRVELEQDAEVLIDLAGRDELPGIDEAFLTNLKAELEAWKAADDAFAEAETNQSELLVELDEWDTKVNQARRNLQLAADTVWPYTEEGTAPVRRSFQLQPNRPLV